MDDWDADGPILTGNLQRLLRDIRDRAANRETLDLPLIRTWHHAMMVRLKLPPGAAAGVFRGEPPLERCEVRVGRHAGIRSMHVAEALSAFEITLKSVVARLDELIPARELPDEDGLAAVIETCAWAHSEFVRIHPFANGNGRTARILANALAMRYGLPPFVRLRPRPGHPYGKVAEASMRGIRRPTVEMFHDMLDACLKSD